MLEFNDLDVVENEGVRRIVSIGFGIGVHVGLRGESLGFLFKEVFVHMKEDVVDKDKEVSAGEVVVMVLNDG